MKVIGVRFRTAGKLYFFTPREFEVKKGDRVIAETARGIEFGTVVAPDMEMAEERLPQPIKPLIRIANQRDIEQEAANRRKEKEAFKVCLEKIRDHRLGMKLIDAEYTFDNNKILFYFTADGRIDFRELVKDLASVFKTRIELRQIGVRDETKIVGGIGICGRPLCCHSYLADFAPVSIKMAKEQNLSLNPTKISGVCGRLMCCLKNEEETYEELNRRLPGIGDAVTTEEGLRGEVHSVNVLRQLVKVVVNAGDEKEIKEFPVEKLYFRRRHSKKEKMELSKEELQALERLEEEEWRKKEQELADRAKENARLREAEGRQSGSRQSGGGQHSQRPGQRQPFQRSETGRRTGNMAGFQRQQNQRPDSFQKQQGQHHDGLQKQQGQRHDGLHKQQGQRSDGFQQQHGQRPDGLQRQQGQRGGKPQGRQQAEQEQISGQHPGDRRGHEGRKRQDRGRQGSARPEGRESGQNGKSHNDNRNRREGRSGQDRQRGSGGDRP